MSTTSKKYFEEKFKEEIWSYFLDNIKKCKSGKELDLVLRKYLPPQEKIMLEKRIGVFYLSEQEIGSREIGRKIDITLKTISFIKRGFKPPVKRKLKGSHKANKSVISDWMLKKNSKMATSYSGKGRWRHLSGY